MKLIAHASIDSAEQFSIYIRNCYNIEQDSQIETQEQTSEKDQLNIDFQSNFFEEQFQQQQPQIVANQRENKISEFHRQSVFQGRPKYSRQIQAKPQYDKVIPKFSELQRHLQALKDLVPEMFDDQFVDRFYAKVYQKIYAQNSKNRRIQPKKQIVTKKQKNPTEIPYTFKNYLPNEYWPQMSHKSQQSKSQEEARFIQNELQMENKQPETMKLQETDDNESIFNQEVLIEIGRIVASVFCEKGYNPEIIEQQLVKNNLTAYKSQVNFYKIVSQILYNAYEFLFTFLTEQCKKQYSPLHQTFGQQFLISYLINCNRNLQPSTCEIFYIIIKGQCSLGQQQLQPDSAIKLYLQLQRKMVALRRKEKYLKVKKEELPKYRRMEVQENHSSYNPKKLSRILLNAIQRAPHPKQIDQVNKLNRVWNSRYESQMISAYKQGRTISQITDYFKDIFPKDRDAFSSVAIRSQLYKILRKSIKKFYTLINKFGSKRLPEVKKLNHYEVRAIIYNNDGIEVRLHLLEIYLAESYDERLIIDTIKEMIKYVDYLQTIKKMTNHFEKYPDEKTQKVTTLTKAFPYNSRALKHG